MPDEIAAGRAAALAAQADAAEKSNDMLAAVRLIGEALALEASLRVANPYYQDLFLRGVVAAKAGRDDEAKRSLDGLRRDAPGWHDLLDAFTRALRDDWQGAAAAADRAAAAAKPLEQPERLASARNALTLKAWKERSSPAQAAEKRAAPKGSLRLISLGVDAPRRVTLDALEALRGCDVLFVNLASDTMMDLLACFCRGEIRPINFVDEETRNTCARLVLDAVAPGRVVGYATYGHVMMLGPLTMLLTRLCRRKGIEFSAVAGVSAVDSVLADSGVVLGDGFGSFQLYDARDLAIPGGVPLNPRAALAVYLTDYQGSDRVGFYTRVQENLTAVYPPSHEALLWGPEGLVARVRLDGLLAMHRRLGGRQQLFVPAVPRGTPGASRARGKRPSAA